jgi:PAS domain-containing protein
VLFLFIEPRFQLVIPNRDDLMSLGLHLLSGAAIAAIGQSARRATARAVASAAEAQAQRQRLEVEIQERERAQAEALRARERFRAAQDQSLYGYTILEAVRDPAGAILDFRWTYANPAAAAILKRPIEGLIGQSLLAQLPGNRERSQLFERYRQIVETGQPYDAEVHYDADGIRGWFRNMTVRFDDGVAVSFFDITDRKQLEAALRLGQERFAVALKHSPILVYNCDAQLRYTWVHNPPAGFSVEQMLGRCDEELVPARDS